MNAQTESFAGPARVALDDCWNRIGVSGNGTCQELAQHIHCRNCPRYASAASLLLERELADAYVDEWTRHVAGARAAVVHNTQSVVIFRIADEWLGLPSGVLTEFVELRPIHSLPHNRNAVLLGLTNVRGELLVCVSLARLLGIGTENSGRSGAAHLGGRLLVIQDAGSRIVFPVDEVHGVQRFEPAQLKPVPATVAKGTATYTRAMLVLQDKVIGCLDEQLLFYTLNRGFE